MTGLVHGWIARLAAFLRGILVSRPADAQTPGRAEPPIDNSPRFYRIAAAAGPDEAARGWSVLSNDRSEAVAEGLTLDQAKTLCRLLNAMSGFAAAERRLPTDTHSPRSQSPER